MFKDNNNTTLVNMLNLNDDGLHNLIQETQNNTQAPILYQLSRNKAIHMWENTLPIHRHIYDLAIMQMYETDLYIKLLNPDCKITSIKANCLAYNNITIYLIQAQHGAISKKCDVPIIHECTINQPSRMRTDTCELTNNTWNNTAWNTNDWYTNDDNLQMDNNCHSYVEPSFLFLGMAGTGKSNYCKRHNEY